MKTIQLNKKVDNDFYYCLNCFKNTEHTEAKNKIFSYCNNCGNLSHNPNFKEITIEPEFYNQ